MEGGVLGVLPGLIGLIQAAEAIKLLTGTGQSLTGRMLHVDTRTMQFRELRLRRDPACPLCGENPTITAPADISFSCTVSPQITPAELRALLAAPDAGLCLLDVREPWEHALSPWPHATHTIPWNQVEPRLTEIPGDAEIIVVCSIGERSAQIVSLLQSRGWSSVRNLKDGLRDFS